MELKEFIKIIRSYLAVIIVLAIVGAAGGFYSTRYFSSGYHHTQDFFLVENLFTQEKARDFTDSAIAILESPDFKDEVLNPGDTLIVRKLAPQVVRLTYISPNVDTSNLQLQSITQKFNLKIQTLTASNQTPELKAIGNSQMPSYSSLNQSVLAVAGVLLGTIFALFVIGLKNYFKI